VPVDEEQTVSDPDLLAEVGMLVYSYCLLYLIFLTVLSD